MCVWSPSPDRRPFPFPVSGRYAIHNANAPDAFLSNCAWHYHRQTLDEGLMHAAAQHLLSQSDLSALARRERHRHLRRERQVARQVCKQPTILLARPR